MIHTEIGNLGFGDRPGPLTRLHQINLIRHQANGYVLVAVVLDGVEPLHDVLEGLALGDVEDEEGALGLPVVAGGDRLVFLGAG